MANSKISEVTISKMKKLVYKILPKLVICEVSTRRVSQDLLFTFAISRKLAPLNLSSNTKLLILVSEAKRTVLYNLVNI